MGFVQEFKEFASKGNAIDLATGLIIGAAFGKIVTSLVEDIIMPPIGMLLGKVDFSNLFIDLSRKGVKSIAEAKAAGVPVIAYGNFINTLINFIIVTMAIFIVIKQMNRLRRMEEDAKKVDVKEGILKLGSKSKDLLKKVDVVDKLGSGSKKLLNKVNVVGKIIKR